MDWCRTCLSCDDEPVSIYKSYNIRGNEYSIIDILSSVTSIRMSSDDKYSKTVCHPCIEKGIAAFEFKITVEESQTNFENRTESIEPEFFNDDLYLVVVENFKKNQNILTIFPSESLVNEEKPFNCKNCDGMFRTFSELKRHRTKHIKRSQIYVEKHAKTNTMQSEDEEHSAVTENMEDIPHFMCDVCGVVKKSKNSLNDHKLMHNQMEDKRICTYCGKAFLSKRYFCTHMLKHKDSDESKLNVFTCDDCGLPFDIKEKLKKHIFAQHSNIKKSIYKIYSKCNGTVRKKMCQ